MNNAEIKKFVLSKCKDVEQACQPLFHLLNIHGFTYMKVYKDGSRFFLTNSETWAENFIDQDYHLMSNYKKYANVDNFMLWKYWPSIDASYHMLMQDGRENFNYDHGLAIFQTFDEYLNLFVLRGYKDRENTNEEYLRYYSYIYKFIDYLQYKISKLIVEAEENKFHVDPGLSLTISDQENLLGYDLPKLNEEFKIPAEFIERMLYKKASGYEMLTRRETQCVVNLIKGMSAKQTARILDLSPRTVEAYIDNIKLKTNSVDRNHMIKQILSFSHNRDIIFREKI